MATKTSRRPQTADAVAATTIDANTETAIATVAVPARRITKAALLRAMLDAPGGVSIASLMAATGWQAHTVRAALSSLRKGGTALAREKVNGGTIYRITPGGAQDAPAMPGTAVPPPTAPDAATVDTEVPA